MEGRQGWLDQWNAKIGEALQIRAALRIRRFESGRKRLSICHPGWMCGGLKHVRGMLVWQLKGCQGVTAG